MTLAEFTGKAASLRCQDCGELGLVASERHPNNGGIRPICPHCGSVRPLAGVLWMSQKPAAAYRPEIAAALDEFLRKQRERT